MDPVWGIGGLTDRVCGRNIELQITRSNLPEATNEQRAHLHEDL